ncbi:LOW QUALITY PROTEIN: E3 ubiquitin-protein ligase BRE1B-like, partial [Phoenicopterus ruber ruber]
MSGAGAKRGAGDGGGGPPEKKPPREEQPPTTLIEPLRLGGISSTEEMDLKVLQFKNKKLAERLEQRQACEDELRERIEKLEKRQATDDATLLLVNRFWGQLDAEVQALLRRYEGEGGAPPAPPGDPPEPRPEGRPPPAPPAEAEGPERREPWGGSGAPPAPPPPPAAPPPAGGVGGGRLGGPAAAFVAALSRSGPEEGELRLRPRLAFAPAAVARLVEGLAGAHRRAHDLGARLAARPELAESGRALLRELLREHRRLQDLTLQLQEKHHRVSLELAELQDKATSAETKVLEMGTTVEGLQWDSAKLRKREGRLDRHLAEALEQLTSGSYGSGSSGGFQGGQITLSMQKFEMLNAELEGNQELANSRMAELEKLQQELQQAVRGHERLKVALRSLPEEAVKETLEYKVLQSQFSLLYHESLQVKTQLDEARALLLATKNSHLRHIEHME